MAQALRHPPSGGSYRVVRLVVTYWILGALTGVACAGLLLILDVARLRTLLFGSDFLWIGLLLLFGGFAVTFGGVICASAIMSVPPDDDSDPDSGLKAGSVSDTGRRDSLAWRSTTAI